MDSNGSRNGFSNPSSVPEEAVWDIIDWDLTYLTWLYIYILHKLDVSCLFWQLPPPFLFHFVFTPWGDIWLLPAFRVLQSISSLRFWHESPRDCESGIGTDSTRETPVLLIPVSKQQLITSLIRSWLKAFLAFINFEAKCFIQQAENLQLVVFFFFFTFSLLWMESMKGHLDLLSHQAAPLSNPFIWIFI